MNPTMLAIILFLLAGFLIFLGKKTIAIGIRLSKSAHSVSLKQKSNVNTITKEVIQKAVRYYAKKGHIITLDSNIIIDHPNIITQLINEHPQNIALSNKVREELDKIKDNPYKPDNIRQCARISLKEINEAMTNGDLIRIIYDIDKTKQLGLDPSIPDNLIIASFKLYEENNRCKIVYITNDSNSRHSAKFLGIETIDGLWTIPNGRNVKTSPMKKAFLVKTIGLAFLSFGISLTVCLFQSDLTSPSASSNQLVKIDNEKFKFTYKAPVYHDNKTYFILDDYNNVYKGYYNELLGGIAIIDIDEGEKLGRFLPVFNTITLAAWFDKDRKINIDNLKISLLSSEGSLIFEKSNYNLNAYSGEDDKKIIINSNNGHLNFKGVNHYLSISYTSEFEEPIIGEGHVLEVRDIFTNELFYTIPLEVLKQPLEEWKND